MSDSPRTPVQAQVIRSPGSATQAHVTIRYPGEPDAQARVSMSGPVQLHHLIQAEQQRRGEQVSSEAQCPAEEVVPVGSIVHLQVGQTCSAQQLLTADNPVLSEPVHAHVARRVAPTQERVQPSSRAEKPGSELLPSVLLVPGSCTLVLRRIPALCQTVSLA